MIKDVVVITPLWKESSAMIQALSDSIAEVGKNLNSRGVEIRHFFLDDCRPWHLPNGVPKLVRHKKNQGLSKTLIDGYEEVLFLKPKPDLVVKIDCQEHDPKMIIPIIDHFNHSISKAVFLPICYWVRGQPRPLMTTVVNDIADFRASLSPINEKGILLAYNQKFPLGFQAFRREVLEQIMPKLEKGYDLFEDRFGQPSWGFDLLAILLSANLFPQQIDFLFGGWMSPWEENRNPEKTAVQREKAEKIIKIAFDLGCL
ncbi:hypothetical protein HYZ76_01685 [Candidatus Falkowbacteria bacterium]|nr:hypothetical protein [Candidatus Falkowbacteria bacterium]